MSYGRKEGCWDDVNTLNISLLIWNPALFSHAITCQKKVFPTKFRYKSWSSHYTETSHFPRILKVQDLIVEHRDFQESGKETERGMLSSFTVADTPASEMCTKEPWEQSRKMGRLTLMPGDAGGDAHWSLPTPLGFGFVRIWMFLIDDHSCVSCDHVQTLCSVKGEGKQVSAAPLGFTTFSLTKH